MHNGRKTVVCVHGSDAAKSHTQPFYGHYTQPFYGPFSGTTRVSRCQKRTSDFIVQGKINRDRNTDHPAGRHSSRSNQSVAISTIPLGWMPFLPPNQQCQSTEGNYCLRIREKTLDFSTVLPAPSPYLSDAAKSVVII